MATLVIDFKKIESDDASKYTTFYSNSKAERLLIIVTLMMYLDQFIPPSHQTYKNLLEVVRAGLLIQL